MKTVLTCSVCGSKKELSYDVICKFCEKKIDAVANLRQRLHGNQRDRSACSYKYHRMISRDQAREKRRKEKKEVQIGTGKIVTLGKSYIDLMKEDAKNRGIPFKKPKKDYF